MADIQASPGEMNALKAYRETAAKLLDAGYYSGLIEAVETCCAHYRLFIMLDCPSGAGKTQACVALSLLGAASSDFKLAGSRQMTVRCLIWPSAVAGQDIYKALNAESNGLTYRFYDCAKAFDFATYCTLRDDQKSQYVWSNLLYLLLEDDDSVELYKSKRRLLLVVIDEIPIDPVEVRLMGRIRDAVRDAVGACIVLSGTNSKAANMVGLSQNVTSSQGKGDFTQVWALTITRLPRFVQEYSVTKSKMSEIAEHPGSSLVLEAIQKSIAGRGNPRLINFAIDAAKTECLNHKKMRNEVTFFHVWQSSFAERMRKNKFVSSGFSQAQHGLEGQLNLILEASATSNHADVLVGHHFAFRIVPDGGEHCFTDQKPGFKDCGGYLYIACQKDRAVGSSLIFVPVSDVILGVDDTEIVWGVSSWQATRFSPPDVDPLLFLMACRGNGYLTVSTHDVANIEYCTHEVVLPFWNSNSVGMINFQNPKAPLESGSLMEVLLAASVANAAAKIHVKSNTDTLAVYIFLLAKELGIEELAWRAELTSDTTLNSISILRFIFPGYIKCQSLNAVIGRMERQRNLDEFDLLLTAGSNEIRFEAKVRQKFGTAELCKAMAKVMAGVNMVGVVVVRKCNDYWMRNKKRNLKKLQDFISTYLKQVGIAYLISSEGDVEMISVCKKRMRRVVLIQVPDSSVREDLSC